MTSARRSSNPPYSGADKRYADQGLNPAIAMMQAIGHVTEGLPNPIDDLLGFGLYVDRDERPQQSVVDGGQRENAFRVLLTVESKQIAIVPNGQIRRQDAGPDAVHIQP